MSSNVFEFRSKVLDLTIAGQQFTMDCREAMEPMDRYSKAFSGLGPQIEAGEKPPEAALELYMEFLDVLLGQGASQKIFADGVPNLSDAYDITEFLTNKIKEQNSIPLNRGARRTGGKQHGKKKQ